MSKKEFFIYTFYKFKIIRNKKIIKESIDKFLSGKLVKGTILVADEGINGSLAATEEDLEAIIKFIKNLLGIRKLEIKVNNSSFLPFNRMKVRLKKEIVSLGKGHLNIEKNRGKNIHPKKWNSIIQDKKTILIDVRNIFEISIGKFRNSTNPCTKSFREFPNQIKKLKIRKNSKIAMYCTGGIRCEKASSYLKKEGYKNIYQLEGGIIKYLEYMKTSSQKSLWSGECFVFDERVTINKNLDKGSYLQCYGCRRPITNFDTKSTKYLKGVHCPYCYNERTIQQKRNSMNRQKQIEKAELRVLNNNFKKIIEA